MVNRTYPQWIIAFLAITVLVCSQVVNVSRIRRQGIVFERHSLTNGESCTIKDGQQGVCIEVMKCVEAARILSGSPSSVQRRFLQERTCRFEGSAQFFCCLTGATETPPTRLPPTRSPPPVRPSPPVVTPGPGGAMSFAEVNRICGKLPVPIMAIVGGMPAPLHAWPWMAAIFIAKDGRISTSVVNCGGVLISDWYVLTAAHCVVDQDTRKTLPPSAFLIRFGDLDISSDSDSATPVEVDAAEIIPHAQFEYNPRAIKNDIALIRLSKRLEFSNSVNPICLPTKNMINENIEGMRAHIAGWGWTKYRGPSSSALQQAQVEIQNNADCGKGYRRIKTTISKNQLCAGFPVGGKDSCGGDSGGPLMFQKSNKWYTIGVTSGGYKCAEAGFPGIYSRTMEFLDWIKMNAKLK